MSATAAAEKKRTRKPRPIQIQVWVSDPDAETSESGNWQEWNYDPGNLTDVVAAKKIIVEKSVTARWRIVAVCDEFSTEVQSKVVVK